MPTFDTANLIMTLDSGLSVFDWEYYYDEWKQWSLGHPDNRKCPPAFSSSGGDTIISGQLNAGGYYFFRNDYGWRMRPPEEDINMYPTGNLIPADSSLPLLIPTVGNFTVGVFGLQPITQSVQVDALSADISALSTQVTGLPAEFWTYLIESGFTAEQIMRGLAAVLAGESSGHDTNNPIYMAANGSKPRIAATTDQYGNRLSVVKDFT